MPPWPVVDGHFRDPRPLQLEQRRQEAVHPREHGKAPEELGAVDAQRAAGIGDGIAGHPVAYAARDARGGLAQPGVLPVGAHAADDVVAFQMIEKPGDIRRVVLQIRVEGDDEAAAGRAEARGEGRRLPRVAPQADDPNRRVLDLEPA